MGRGSCPQLGEALTKESGFRLGTGSAFPSLGQLLAGLMQIPELREDPLPRVTWDEHSIAGGGLGR